MMSLKIDPGEKALWIARFCSGSSGFSSSSAHSLWLMRRANWLGSKAGRLAMTKISPLRASKAIIAPG